MPRKLVTVLALAAMASLANAQIFKFWDMGNLGSRSDWPKWSTSGPPPNQMTQVPDGVSATGTVGVGWIPNNPKWVGPSNWDYLSDWNTNSLDGNTGASNNCGAADGFGTFQQAGWQLATEDDTANCVELSQPCIYSNSLCPTNSLGQFCGGVYWMLGLDFTKYDATSMGAPSAGATSSCTYVGLAAWFNGIPYGASQTASRAKMTIQILATKQDGTKETDFSSWKLFLADGEDDGGGYRGTGLWNITSSGLLVPLQQYQPNTPSPLTTFGMIRLPESPRYTQVNFNISSEAFNNDDPGYKGNCNTMYAFVASASPPPTPAPTSAPTPAGCFPSPNAFASTSPQGKVAPAKVFSYSATLVNKNSAAIRELQGTASGQGMGAIKAPYFNASFSMALPPGVTLISSASSPKVATTPTVTNGLLSWPLNTSLKPGGKLKVVLKLSAAACTTPKDLLLIGRFRYTDSVGPKTVSACLKKPLYVWADSCPPIPKAGQKQKQVGTKPGESWNKCDCKACKCNGKTCACPQNGCTCTVIPV